jgi:biopolymer transport protein ExbD
MKRERNKIEIGHELDMKPFINFMVILAVALLVCVEFSKIAYLRIQLPADHGAGNGNRDTDRPVSHPDRLSLTAIITDSVVTLGAKNGFMPSIRYKEFHRYVDKIDNSVITVPYTRNAQVRNPATGRLLTPGERTDVLLYVVGDDGQICQSLHTEKGEPVIDAVGLPLRKVLTGDTVYTIGIPHRMLVVRSPDRFTSQPLSVCDELKSRLVKIRERFGDAEDAEEIIIAAEDNVLYDKIVQVMDVSREAGYSEIGFSKLRS